MDDNFFNYHKKLAFKKNLKLISFGIKNKSSMIKLINIKKLKINMNLSIKCKWQIIYLFILKMIIKIIYIIY